MVQKLAGRHTKGTPLFKGYPLYGSEAHLPKYGCETRKTSFPAVKAKNPRRPGKDGGAKQHFSLQNISRFKNASHFTRYSSFTRPSSSS